MKTVGLNLISLLALVGALSFAGCGDSNTSGQTVTFSGIAWSFELPGTPYGRISGATVSVLEMPGMETTTNTDGEFTIEGLPVGSQVTLVLEHEDHPLTYTKTHTVPDTDLDDLTFQIPTNSVFALIELGLVGAGVTDGIDPTRT